jgi:hypothetical protein
MKCCEKNTNTHFRVAWVFGMALEEEEKEGEAGLREDEGGTCMPLRLDPQGPAALWRALGISLLRGEGDSHSHVPIIITFHDMP